MREEGLADEYALQSWFISRINKFLTQHGKQIIGWDEILEGGISPGAIVMSWRVGGPIQQLCPCTVSCLSASACHAEMADG